MSELWKEKNYLNPLPYLISHHITEYDIQKANINVLYNLGLINQDYYDRLNKADRMERQIEIGYLLKYTEGLYDKLSKGIEDFRHKFFDANGIEDGDILSIKNDAIFIIDKNIKVTKFDNIVFREKNTYTSYMKLNSIEVYFENDPVDGTASLDIKGISDVNLDKHHQYMATFIADMMMYMESGDIESGLTYLGEFYNNYVDRKLDIGYYRNFNAESDYNIMANGTVYSVPYCNPNMARSIDISCNLGIIRLINSYLTNMYFSK